MNLKVLLVSNQVRGLDGTGGLADVAFALPKALRQDQDVDVRIITPGFAQVVTPHLEHRFDKLVFSDLKVPFGNDIFSMEICEFDLNDNNSHDSAIPCYLIKSDQFTKADDSPKQAILFCRAVVEFLRQSSEFQPDLIHCNDWYTGLIPVYLNTLFENDPHLGRIATLYTTHNAGYGYQGAFPSSSFPYPDQQEILHWAGLSDAQYQTGITRSLEHMSLFNFSKGGLGYSDLINTVSMTYAREILKPPFGGGFDGLLNERAHDLCGIVNGIDSDEWNPATDTFTTPNHFSVKDSVEKIIQQKQSIRESLQSWSDYRENQPFKYIAPHTTLFGIVSRITDQKVAILNPILAEFCKIPGVQLAILGNAHPADPVGQSYISQIQELSKQYPEKIALYDGFDIGLSHLLYASSDFFLMPSSYEPCGLAQLIAMRYGTVPIVHAVGGLDDTVIDETNGRDATGFKFKSIRHSFFDVDEIQVASRLLLDTIVRAITVKRNYPERWIDLIKNGMVQDFSWSIPASQYVKLYQAAIRRRVESHFFL